MCKYKVCFYSNKNNCFALKAHTNKIKAHAKPYTDISIESINTGLQKGFKYCPLFKNSIQDVWIELTGSRKLDYLKAEKVSAKMHTPKKTVWHHVWKQNSNGEYLMQLVDFHEHQKTCPHAGGCKKWEIEHTKKYRAHKRANPLQWSVFIGNNLLDNSRVCFKTIRITK